MWWRGEPPPQVEPYLFGISDAKEETWARSEEHVVSFCREKLRVSLDPADIERAHRMGRYTEAKKRPIIVKFARFKTKSLILSATSQLKNSGYTVREDYSARVRLARKKLFAYAQQNNAAFKMRFNKLVIGSKQYVYNDTADTVTELLSS